RALAFHRLGLQLELKLAESALQDGRTAEGMLRLQRVADAENPALRSEALFRLGSTLASLGWHQDALDVWKSLQRESPVSLSNKQNSHTVAEQGIAAARNALSRLEEPAAPWHGPWTLQRVGV